MSYRIEPLLLPEGVANDELPPPLFLSPDGKTIRLHVKARQVFNNFGSLSEIFNKSVETAAAAAAAADKEAALKMDNLDSSRQQATKKVYEGCIKGKEVSFNLGGRSSRVDFQIQPGVIDNEYLSAVTAHSSYFIHDDVIDFIIFNTKTEEFESNDLD